MTMPSARPEKTGHIYAGLVAIILLGASLRVYHLGDNPLWLDEARLYWIAQGNLTQIISENSLNNSAPPLYAILIALVSRINESEMGLRAVSCLASILAILAIYFLARQFVPRAAACCVAVIIAVAPTQVQYAQQMREYSLAFLIAVLMLLFFARYLAQRQSHDLAIFAATSVGGIFTQYGLALLFTALSLVWLAQLLRPKTNLTSWFVVNTIAFGAVALVWTTTLRWQIRPGGFGASGTATYLMAGYWTDESLMSLANLAILNTRDLLNFTFSIFNLVVLLIGTGVAYAWNSKSSRIVLALFALPMLTTLVAAALRLYPYGGMRQDIFLTPMIFVLIGCGFAYIQAFDQRRVAVVLLVGLCGVLGMAQSIQTLNAPALEDIRPVVETLRAQYAPNDQIYIYYGANPAFRYYYRDHANQWILGIEDRAMPENYFHQIDAELKPGRVWLVFAHCYNAECDQITDYVSRTRKVERIVSMQEAILYRADAGTLQ